jgi:hypothetical protein
MFKTTKLLRGFTEISVLYDLAQKNDCVICGGYARYCASPLSTKKVKEAWDVDIFPKSEQACDDMLKDLISLGYKKDYENHVSITMAVKGKKHPELNSIPTPQIIKPVIEGKIVTLGTVEEILNNFDFTIVRAAIISPTEVMVDEDFLDDELHGILRLKNIHCPISSLLRCCKYARKGYFMRPFEALKLFQDWTNRGPDYQLRIIELFSKSSLGDKDPNKITRKEIDELEALLRID